MTKSYAVLAFLLLIGCQNELGTSAYQITGGVPLSPITNGSRLKHIQVKSSDGSVSTGLFLVDSVLSAKWHSDIKCSFSADDFGFKCVPLFNYSVVSGYYFADAKCTIAVATTAISGAPVFYARRQITSGFGIKYNQYYYIAREHTGPVYLNSTSCAIAASPGLAYIPGSVVLSGEFVTGEEVTE